MRLVRFSLQLASHDIQNPDDLLGVAPLRMITLLFGFLSFTVILPACARSLPSTPAPLPASPTSTPQPALTMLPSPTEIADFLPTPTQIPQPTEIVEVIPSPVETLPPGSDWEGPGFVYIKDATLMISNFDGSRKSVMADDPVGSWAWAQDFSAQAGRFIYGLGSSLWVVDLGEEPHSILLVDGYLESPVISADGTKIAYSLVIGFEEDQPKQLWTINPDGTENSLAIDNTGQFITDPGPFRLIPVAWSLDNTKVYLVTTTDSEATPVGMYVADLATGIIDKALTPQVTLWDVSFSPDRTRIAYRTFQWKPVPGSMPEVGPPFTLNVTDLTTGETRVLLESEADQFFLPVWSGDGNRLAYSVRQDIIGGDIGLFTIDLVTGLTSMVVQGPENSRLVPWAWLSEERLVYTDDDISSDDQGESPMTLYSITIAGEDNFAIDTGSTITVLGAVDG